MSYVRTVKQSENPYVILDKGFIGNETMTLKATGLLTYFLSKPDGWQIRLKDVRRRFTDGETSVRSGLNELMKLGYINRERERDENGRFGDYVYKVYERPEFNPEFNPKRENRVQDLPKRGFPVLDNPEQGNHVHSNNDLSNNDFINKEEEEESLQQLLNFYFENISKTGGEIIKSKLADWITKLPISVIAKELETCSLYGAKSWNYVEKALLEDLDRGITSLEDLEAKYIAHSKRDNKKPSRGRRKPIREEKLPEWYNEHQKQLEAAGGNYGGQEEDYEEKKRKMMEIQRKYKEKVE